MLDNNEIAILIKVNELAHRYGINPCDFIASYRDVSESNESVLFYEMPAAKDARQEQRFLAMLDSLGIDVNTSKLTGSPEHIYDSLDKAIQIAPKTRVR